MRDSSVLRAVSAGTLALALAAGAALVPVGGAPAAEAATIGECGSYQDQDPNSVPNASRVIWAGHKWDLIGLNLDGAGGEQGLAGPDGTATLLLDKSPMSQQFATKLAFRTSYSIDSGSLVYHEYSGSGLQKLLANKFEALYGSVNLYNPTNEVVHRDVVPRDLVGGSEVSTATSGYSPDAVAGAGVGAQGFWALSVAEAARLRDSVRSYTDYWWLRTPGVSADYAALVSPSGVVMTRGSVVSDANTLARPAVYVKISTSGVLNQSLNSAGNTGAAAAVVGTCPVAPTVSVGGYVWDVVGYNNNGTKLGVASDTANTATLLLSNSSAKRFEFPAQKPAGRTYGNFDRVSPYTNEYSTSDLRAVLTSASTSLNAAFAAAGATVVPRELPGGAVMGDNSAAVAGVAVSGASLWPFSTQEAGLLSLQARVFGDGWWLRSPGNSSGKAAIVRFNGDVSAEGINVVSGESVAPRPALYVRLTAEITTKVEAALGDGNSLGAYMPPSLSGPVPSTAPLNLPKSKTLKKGKSFTLKPKAAGTKIKTVKFTTSKKSVATVTTKGKVVAKKPGTAYILVSATLSNGSKLSQKVKIVVVKPVTAIKGLPKSKKVRLGKSVTLKPKPNGTKPVVTYTSSKPGIAKVTPKGKITAIKKGKTTIKVKAKTADGSTKTKKVTIIVSK
jgi:hypothetical protein